MLPPRIVQNVAGIEQTALDNRAERNARLTLFGTELKTKFVFDALHGINARLCAFDIMLVLFNADKIAAELFGYGTGRPRSENGSSTTSPTLEEAIITR